MKCPKCQYIGFETGDQCKNCGYDFSLLIGPDTESAALDAPPDLMLRDAGGPLVDERARPGDMSNEWDEAPGDRFRTASRLHDDSIAFEAARPPSPGGGPALPLFAPDPVDDEPLVRLPPLPRAPLAVRKTPDTPRLRAASAAERTRVSDEPVLEFGEEPAMFDDAAGDPAPAVVPPAARQDGEQMPAGAFGPRVMAAALDHAILLGIDATVVYFTLRLTALGLGDWRVLPVLPLAVFLLSLKLAYFTAFTVAGGQTIGKMATHIRVVTDDARGLDAARSVKRALVGLASLLTFGAAFVPALLDPARRAVHDRAAGTRVVGVPSR